MPGFSTASVAGSVQSNTSIRTFGLSDVRNMRELPPDCMPEPLRCSSAILNLSLNQRVPIQRIESSVQDNSAPRDGGAASAGCGEIGERHSLSLSNSRVSQPDFFSGYPSSQLPNTVSSTSTSTLLELNSEGPSPLPEHRRETAYPGFEVRDLSSDSMTVERQTPCKFEESMRFDFKDQEEKKSFFLFWLREISDSFIKGPFQSEDFSPKTLSQFFARIAMSEPEVIDHLNASFSRKLSCALNTVFVKGKESDIAGILVCAPVLHSLKEAFNRFPGGLFAPVSKVLSSTNPAVVTSFLVTAVHLDRLNAHVRVWVPSARLAEPLKLVFERGTEKQKELLRFAATKLAPVNQALRNLY